MDSAEYLAHLRRELDAFAACLSGDLSARVEYCGDWTLYDLADHLGRQNLWAAAAVTEQHGDLDPPPAPREPAALAAWFRGTCDTELAALDTDPSAPAWTIAPPPTVGFWQRRRCLETLVHRWDAEHALGIPSRLDPELAGDGVAEVIDTMAPRQVRLGRTAAPRTRSGSPRPTPDRPGRSAPATRWPRSTAPRPACCSCCGAGAPPTIPRWRGLATARPGGPCWPVPWSPERA